MSKLDGNKRWQASKWVMTEHHEAYEDRNQAVTGRATAEELLMVRDCMLMPYMETMIQKSIGDIERSSNILRRLYVLTGQNVLDQIVQDRYKLRKELRKRNIQILSGTEEHSDIAIHIHFKCRGYEERFGVTREVLRALISKRLGYYTDRIIALYKEGGGAGVQ